MNYPWFRLYSKIIASPKIKSLTVPQRWIWVGLLSLANESATRGVLEVSRGRPFTVRDVAHNLAMTPRQIRAALDAFAALDMIHMEQTAGGPAIAISNWNHYQYEPSTTRVHRHRRAGAADDDGSGELDDAAAPGPAAAPSPAMPHGATMPYGATMLRGAGYPACPEGPQNEPHPPEEELLGCGDKDAPTDSDRALPDDGRAAAASDGPSDAPNATRREAHPAKAGLQGHDEGRVRGHTVGDAPARTPRTAPPKDKSGNAPSRFTTRFMKRSPETLLKREDDVSQRAYSDTDTDAEADTDPESGERERLIHPSLTPSIDHSQGVQGDAQRKTARASDEGDGAAGENAPLGAGDPASDGDPDGPGQSDGPGDPPEEDQAAGDEECALAPSSPHKSWRIEEKIGYYAAKWAPAGDPAEYVRQVFKLWKKTRLNEDRMYCAVCKAVDVTDRRLAKDGLVTTNYMGYLLQVLRNEVLPNRSAFSDAYPRQGY